MILVSIGEENIPVPLTGRYNDTNTYVVALALSVNQHIHSTKKRLDSCDKISH